VYVCAVSPFPSGVRWIVTRRDSGTLHITGRAQTTIDTAFAAYSLAAFPSQDDDGGLAMDMLCVAGTGPLVQCYTNPSTPSLSLTCLPTTH
jgi:hypothetical protein